MYCTPVLAGKAVHNRLDPIQEFAHEVEQVQPFSSNSQQLERDRKRFDYQSKSVLKQPILLKQIHKLRILDRKKGKLLHRILGFGDGCSGIHHCCKLGLLHSCCKGTQQHGCCRNQQPHMEFADDGLEPVDTETIRQQNTNQRRRKPASEIQLNLDQDTGRRKSASLDQIVFIGKLNALPTLKESIVSAQQPQSYQQPYKSSYSSVPTVHSITGFLTTSGNRQDLVDGGREHGTESIRPLQEDIAYLRTFAERLRPLLNAAVSSPSSSDSSSFSASNGFSSSSSSNPVSSASQIASSVNFKSPLMSKQEQKQRIQMIHQNDDNIGPDQRS